jgi:cyanate permease
VVVRCSGSVALTAIVSASFLAPEPVVLLATCLLGLGIARSCLVPVALLVLMDTEAEDSQAIGTMSGLFFATGQIGGMLGPVLCGLAIDVSGDYDAPLWLMSFSMVLLLGLIVRLRQLQGQNPPRPADRNPASER